MTWEKNEFELFNLVAHSINCRTGEKKDVKSRFKTAQKPSDSMRWASKFGFLHSIIDGMLIQVHYDTLQIMKYNTDLRENSNNFLMAIDDDGYAYVSRVTPRRGRDVTSIFMGSIDDCMKDDRPNEEITRADIVPRVAPVTKKERPRQTTSNISFSEVDEAMGRIDQYQKNTEEITRADNVPTVASFLLPKNEKTAYNPTTSNSNPSQNGNGKKQSPIDQAFNRMEISSKGERRKNGQLELVFNIYKSFDDAPTVLKLKTLSSTRIGDIVIRSEEIVQPPISRVRLVYQSEFIPSFRTPGQLNMRHGDSVLVYFEKREIKTDDALNRSTPMIPKEIQKIVEKPAHVSVALPKSKTTQDQIFGELQWLKKYIQEKETVVTDPADQLATIEAKHRRLLVLLGQMQLSQ